MAKSCLHPASGSFELKIDSKEFCLSKVTTSQGPSVAYESFKRPTSLTMLSGLGNASEMDGMT